MIEERPDIGVENPVDPSLPQPIGERVQRVMLSASGPEPVAEPQELRLVDWRQERHHCRLDDLVLQCGDMAGIRHLMQFAFGMAEGDEPNWRPIPVAVDLTCR